VDYLIAQQALYIVAAGLLGLVLGWWLGRSSSGKAVDRAVNEWQERLASSEIAHEEASQEVQRLAGQVSGLNIEVEESRDKAVSLAAKLADSQRQLAGERKQAGDLRLQTEERDSKNSELTSEISRWRHEAETLQQELLAAQEDLRRVEDALEQERDRDAEREAATARYERRIAALETAISTRRGEEDGLRARMAELRGQYAELDEEATRLRRVKLEFQEWMRGAAQREEEMGHTHRQLVAAGNERDALAAELASLQGALQEEGSLRSALDQAALDVEVLEGELDRARRETSSLRGELDQRSLAADALQRELEELRIRSQDHEATVAASRGDHRELTEELARAGDRIRELEAQEALASRLAAEIEDLHAEVAAGMERERDLRHRAEASEAARAEAAEELATLLSAPLVDVDRLATARAATSADDSGDTSAATRDSGPELLEAPRGAADDLKRVRGIGPVLESLLNRLGVYHFRQIASWTPEEISWVASHVNTFPDRIERDGWTIQAAALQGGRDGEEE
jgi:predicted flap endonuclease-1-like 5' DNA nuclease